MTCICAPGTAPGMGTLQAEKKIGLTVTESCLMLPIKSVSAVIGLTSNQESCHVHKCAACSNTTCPFRKV